MPSIARQWIVIGAILGALGVGFGAYGAHGLSELLTKRFGYSGDDLTHRLALFETAVRYQMYHAVALVLIGLALAQQDTKSWRFAGWAFLVGVLIFSGLLKIMTFASHDWNWLGAIVPIGGVSLIIGWVALAVGAFKQR